MQIKIIESGFDKKVFDSKAVNVMQSWEWGEAKAKTGVEIVRLSEFEVDNLKNVYQITLHKIPYTNYRLGYIPHSKLPTTDVLNFLYDYGKKNKLIFIKFEPYVLKKELPPSPFTLHKSPHPLFPNWTIMLDLTKSEDELFKNLKAKTRYNIKLAQKKGIIVREESTDKGFEKFIKLYIQTCKRQKYFGHNTQYHKIIWNSLKANIAHILIAYCQDIPLVAYELFLFNDVLYYPYGGSSNEYRNLMPANLLMWEAIKFGKKNNAKTFDMWGAREGAGFTRFKEGYGGEFVEFTGSLDYVISPFLYKIYNLVNNLRNQYLNLRLNFTS